MWILLAVIAAFVGIYLLILRPILHRVAALKNFYAEADTFWEKVKAIFFKSATVAWAAFIEVWGFILSQLDNIAQTFGDPDFKAQVTTFLGADTTKVGIAFMIFAAVTFAARMRSVPKA